MRAYRLLLHVYPTSFRNEYGEEMAAIFARRLRDAGGPASRAAVWLETLAEVAWNAALIHLDVLQQDLRFVARTLRRSPGFAVTAVLIVALGIGATTAAFSVTDFVLIRPLPFRDPGRLVSFWETTPGYSKMELSGPNYRDWTAAAKCFESVGVYHDEAATFSTGGEPHRFVGASVSAGVFPTLGVAPLLGRAFMPDDDRAGAPGTIVLSYQLWQTEFGGDPTVIGRSMSTQFDLERGEFTVVGIMPRDFHFPQSDVLFWVTNRFPDRVYSPEERTDNWLNGIARLRRGVTLEQARAELDLIAADSRQRYPVENRDTGAVIVPLGEALSERSRLLLIALSAAAGCVLLIACANLANLLLARALERRRELAVRSAIGAGRERLARQLLTESILLALLGGAIGIAIAFAAVPLLSQLVPTTLPIASVPSVDLRVLTFAAALSVITGVAFGVVPILRVGRAPDINGLRESVRSGGGHRERLRSVLVVAEVVASVVLLVSSGLLIRALLRIQAIDPGFNPDHVLTLRTDLPMPQYEKTATREIFYGRVIGDVRALPGVRSAGFISFLPMSSFRGGVWPVTVPGDPGAGAEVRRADNVAAIRFVTPGFFAAMAIPIARGRDISDGDDRGRRLVAVVSQSFVRRYFPNEDPIGRHFTFAYADREVVGVVGDVRFRGLERTSEPQVYLPSRQVADGAITFYAPKALAIRTVVPPAQIAPAVRDIVRRADSGVAITELQTLADLVDRDTASRAAQVRVLIAFAAVAFMLAAVGIHALLSFAVSQRSQEIGIRVALGAQPRDILAMVVWNALRLGAIGLAVGMFVAYAAGRSMEALLAGIRPDDAATFGAAMALVAAMVVIGTLVPTLRALRVDPITAIRAE